MLIKGYHQLKRAIEHQTDRSYDNAKEKFSKLYSFFETKIPKLNEKIKNVEKSYEEACVCFCENPKDSTEKLGEKIYSFFEHCRNAKRNLIKIEEDIKKEVIKKMKNEEHKKMIEEKKQQMKDSPSKQGKIQLFLAFYLLKL